MADPGLLIVTITATVVAVACVVALLVIRRREAAQDATARPGSDDQWRSWPRPHSPRPLHEHDVWLGDGDRS